MINIDSQGPKISDRDIDLLELEIGCALPEVYRKFLLSTNGGLPSPDVVDIEELEDSPVDVQVFFGMNRNVETSNIYWNLKFIRNNIGCNRVLPIACDSGGCFFCLNMDHKDPEVIYFDVNDTARNIYCVSPNFSSFLEKIRAWV